MKAIFNAKIKRREAFSPFAPFRARQSCGEWIHVDDPGRLQTVYCHTNPRSYRLIEYFGI
jgi:predicted NodU family carbamoyl transferase